MSRLNKQEKNRDAVCTSIENWYTTHTYGPTYRDLAKMTDLSLGTVYSVCKELRDSGMITYEDGMARTIRIVER